MAPALFRLLNELADDSVRLRKFLGIEVTKTCLLSSNERSLAGKAGLPERMLCGGDVIVTEDENGPLESEGEPEHLEFVIGIKYAACENRRDY